jgi:hypothetical protein
VGIDSSAEAPPMKATFEPGRRYRVRFSLPAAITPALVLATLKSSLHHVLISEAQKGVVTVEATWRGKRRALDTDFLLSCEIIQ